MENVLIAIFCIALILFGGLTIAHMSMSSTDSIAVAWKEMEDRSGEIARTSISSVSASTLEPAGSTIEITLENSGETKLEDFDEWDVIVQYTDTSGSYVTKRLSHTAGALGNNEWKVEGIYLTASPTASEIVDTGIFNPDEEMVIQMLVNPAVGTPTANLATIATYNGVSVPVIFTRE